MEVCQILACLVDTVDRNKPARRFGDHDQARDTDGREEHLEQRW
jgi:hypothetical protein